jgi:hypothetical protein
MSTADVRFGSKADMCNAPTHVRFTPNSDRESGRNFVLRGERDQASTDHLKKRCRPVQT